MSALAPTLQAFFADRLIRQRDASGHTIAAYRDTWRLLLAYTSERIGIAAARLELTDLDAPLIAAFLEHLEHQRGNSVRTRNARLAAIHSLFRFAALAHPEHAETIARVLAIPPKRFDRAVITYLTEPQVDALLAACDLTTWTGRRDHALLLLAVQTGLRISELTALTRADIHLGVGAHVACHGKGRKDRITPLTAGTVTVLRGWLDNQPGEHTDPLFPTLRSACSSRSFHPPLHVQVGNGASADTARRRLARRSTLRGRGAQRRKRATTSFASPAPQGYYQQSPGYPQYVAPGYYQQPPPKKKPVWPWVLGGTFLVMLLGIGGCLAFVGGVANNIAKESAPEVVVTCEVTGSDDSAAVTFSARDFNIAQETDVPLPWSKQVTIDGLGKTVTLTGTNGADEVVPDLVEVEVAVPWCRAGIVSGLRYNDKGETLYQPWRVSTAKPSGNASARACRAA